jgi:YfiH family protein
MGAFTTTRGGLGVDGEGEANLSVKTGGGPAHALGNRDLLARQVGLTSTALAFAEQVHGPAVAVVEQSGSEQQRGVRGVDALVTRTPGLGLVTLAADCMPVLLADVSAGVVAAAHAGRPGLLAGVLQATVAVMTEQGASAAGITAVVGPCIGGCCYELPAGMVEDLDAQLPGLRAVTGWGTPSVDLRAGADAVLAAVGVRDVRHVGGCTFEQPDLLYSFRRTGTADRHGGLVVLP